MSTDSKASWRPDPSWRQDAAGNVKPGWVLYYDGQDRVVHGVKVDPLEPGETEHSVSIWFHGLRAHGDEGQTVYVVQGG